MTIKHQHYIRYISYISFVFWTTWLWYLAHVVYIDFTRSVGKTSWSPSKSSYNYVISFVLLHGCVCTISTSVQTTSDSDSSFFSPSILIWNISYRNGHKEIVVMEASQYRWLQITESGALQSGNRSIQCIRCKLGFHVWVTLPNFMCIFTVNRRLVHLRVMPSPVKLFHMCLFSQTFYNIFFS